MAKKDKRANVLQILICFLESTKHLMDLSSKARKI